MGHAVELAEDGQMAIEVYKKAESLGRPFDVVLLDLTVREGMGGQEAIQELLKMDPDVKAIAMSGYLDSPVILEPERHGFKGAMPKPFDVDTLQEILDASWAARPRHEEKAGTLDDPAELRRRAEARLSERRA